jgi:hypothetical protein
MGRAIETDNRLDDHERRIKLVEDALEEMLQNNSRVHHVDLNAELSKHEESIRKENEEGEFTPPAGRRKKTSTKKPAKVE